jgi:hypothetical protein
MAKEEAWRRLKGCCRAVANHVGNIFDAGKAYAGVPIRTRCCRACSQSGAQSCKHMTSDDPVHATQRESIDTHFDLHRLDRRCRAAAADCQVRLDSSNRLGARTATAMV